MAGVTLPVEKPGCTNVYWMYSILIDAPYRLTHDELIPALRSRGIDSRPFFYPLDAPAPLPYAGGLAGCTPPEPDRAQPAQLAGIDGGAVKIFASRFGIWGEGLNRIQSVLYRIH